MHDEHGAGGRVRHSVRCKIGELGFARFGVVWFTQEGSDKPAKPPFTPVFGKPTVEPAIPGLAIGEPTTTDGLTWHFKLTMDPKAELDEQWLADDGQLCVMIPCEEAPAKP